MVIPAHILGAPIVVLSISPHKWFLDHDLMRRCYLSQHNSAGRSKEEVSVVMSFHEAIFMWPDRDGLIDT